MASQIEIIIWIIISAFGLIIVGSIITIWLLRRRYRHIRYIIRYLRNDRVQVFEDRARVVKKKSGNYWLTQSTKRLVPIPPSECLDVPVKGKIFVESYWSEGGDIIYAKATTDGFEPIQPTTAAQRMMFANEIELANRSGETFFQKHGAAIVGGSIVIVLFTLLFVFWGDLLQPAKEFAGAMQTTSQNLAEVADKLEQILSERQIIRSPAPP